MIAALAFVTVTVYDCQWCTLFLPHLHSLWNLNYTINQRGPLLYLSGYRIQTILQFFHDGSPYLDPLQACTRKGFPSLKPPDDPRRDSSAYSLHPWLSLTVQQRYARLATHTICDIWPHNFAQSSDSPLPLQPRHLWNYFRYFDAQPYISFRTIRFGRGWEQGADHQS